MKLSLRFSAAIVPALLLVACGGDDTDEKAGADRGAATRTYANIVHASYADSLAEVEELDRLCKAFVAAPSQASLDQARNAWLAAREPYLQTEVYRFYDGPIDNQVDGPEGLINAWPLDEAYIDYVTGAASDDSIIHDPTKTISAESLMDLNEAGGEENIATGFHAVEFLLWGQDQSDTGPGNRPYTDYVAGGARANADRRGAYLTTVSSLLVTHLTGLVEAWAPGTSGNYRSELEAAAADEALRRILTGMIVLSGFETGGERLQTALDSGDQEDEHSCFSDNTHRDMVQDIQGVKNVWTGNYTRLDGTRVSGTSVRAVVREKDAALATELDTQIDQSLSLANALQPPFDNEIQSDNTAGRERIRALVTALGRQEELLQQVFQRFGLNVPPPPL
ncbi:MAG TPA: imelysin family protein [Polyangiaceae bacterium]|nr:imelysin family protein [Polyangiaceae bacterium]